MNKRSNQAEMPHSFTPGPWARIIADGYTVRHPQIYSDTGPIANATFLGNGRVDELNANARLIAAAPDLLDVAEMVLALATIDTPPELIKAATAAIAKARGAA